MIDRIASPPTNSGSRCSPDGEHLAFIGTNVVNDAAAGRLVIAGKDGGFEDLFQQASPLYHVEKAQTPILIVRGDADPRVDPTQSRMFRRLLKLQEDEPPVRLVLYPDEGHGQPACRQSLRLFPQADALDESLSEGRRRRTATTPGGIWARRTVRQKLTNQHVERKFHI